MNVARAFPTRLIPTRLIPARIRELLSAAAPGDAVAGRSRSRNRRIAASAATAMFAKLLSVGVALLTVPLTLGYLGSERYGMWLIMSSFVAILSFADLGVGNGVLDTVAAAHRRGDRGAIRAAVLSEKWRCRSASQPSSSQGLRSPIRTTRAALRRLRFLTK